MSKTRMPKEIFKLSIITDNPLFEGFAFPRLPSLLGRDELSDDFLPEDDQIRDWTAARLAKRWKPARVAGRVTSFQDYPCVDMTIPAFSRRAVDALREFLEPNGELLPLKSDVGEYYAYNITTVADVLDVKKSVAEFWCDPPTTAVDVNWFAFRKTKLRGLSIFRIPELANYTLVTDDFRARVHECGLNGFFLTKIWPLPARVRWRNVEARERKKPPKTKTSRGTKAMKANTVMLYFSLSGAKASAREKKLLSQYEKELDAQLVVDSLDAPYFGSLEGRETLAEEIALFISCPDADLLVTKLWPWLVNIVWTGDFEVIKRYGDLHEVDAPEEPVPLDRKAKGRKS